MTEDRWVEMAPLHALGVLDGDDLAGFEAHASSCLDCSEELRAHASVVSAIPLALVPVIPATALRGRVLGGQGRQVPPAPAARTAPLWLAGLAAAAGVILAVATLTVRGQRDAARTEALRARQEATAARADAERAAAALLAAQRELGEAVGFRALVQRPGSRIVTLAGLATTPRARARVVFDPATREAVLVASGLPPVPAGKAYEAWVIASGAPVAAGVFRPDADGRAVLRLPAVDATLDAKTFAVTIEPEAGTTSPTGPMVMAGAVS